MADISSMIVQNAFNDMSQQPDLAGAFTGGVQHGAQLAQTVENIQKQKADIENQKQQIQLAKIAKLNDLYETGGKLPEGKLRNAYMKNIIPNAAKALGADQWIHPANQEIMNADPSVLGALKQSVPDLKSQLGVLAEPDGLAKVAASVEQYKAQQALTPLPSAGQQNMTPANAPDAQPAQSAPMTPNPDLQGQQTQGAAQPQSQAPQRSQEVQDEMSQTLKTHLETRLRQGLLNMSDLAGPKGQFIAQSLGYDPATLKDVLETYPSTLTTAEKEGIQNNAMANNARIRNAGLDERQRKQLVVQTQNEINKDTMLNNFDQRAVGARRLTGLIDNALTEKDPTKRVAKTKQLLGAVAAEESALVTGKNNFSEGSTERAAYESAAAEMATLKDKFGSFISKDGTVTDVQGLTAALKNARVQAHELGRSYVNEINAHLDTLTAGAIPEQQKIFDDKKKAFKDKFDGAFEVHTFKVRGQDLTIDQIKALPPAAQRLLPDDVKKAAGIK